VNEPAIDLQRVDTEVLEIGKRTQTRAKVIKRYAAAEVTQTINERLRLVQIRYG